MPDRARTTARPIAAAGALVFLAAFALYLATHAASIYLDDSGETVTVAACLGVGHPPGYPLYTLLSHLACLAPLGGPAEAVNLLGALFGALCVAGVFALLLGAADLTSPIAAWASALLPAAVLGVGPVFWHNALDAKGSIYQLNNLLSVALLGLLAGPPTPARHRAFWLVLGLALAHHYMSQLTLLPAYAALLWEDRKAALGRAWLVAPGLALILYLPLRSALHPDLNWGGVHGPRSLAFFLLRLEYATGDISRSWSTSLAQAAYALKLMLREGAGVLTAAAAVGLAAGRRERFVRALALGWLTALAAVTFYMNLKPERLVLLRPYLFPAYLCQALLAGRGLRAALARVRPAAAAGILAAGLAACAALGAWEYPALDLSDYFFALDNARGLLAALPPRALLLCQGDAVVFPLWYAQRVLGERPDVAVAGTAVLPMAWVRHDLRRHWGDLVLPHPDHPLGAESVGPLTAAVLALNPQRPAYASFNRFDPPVPGWSLVPAGPAFRCVAGAAPSAAGDWTRLDRAALRLESMPLRGYTRRPLDRATLAYFIGDMAVRANALGLWAEDAGDAARARRFYRRAARLDPGCPDYAFNTGNALYELGDRTGAARAFGLSVRLDPAYVNGWYNRGVTELQLGKVGEARACLERARALAPGRNDVLQALRQAGGG